MAGKRKTPKKDTEPQLVWDDGYWWIVDGAKKENVGRSRRYAEKLLADKQGG